MGLKVAILALLGVFWFTPSEDLYFKVTRSLRFLTMDSETADGRETVKFCTAFAVAPQRYLTAAHCVTDGVAPPFLDHEIEAAVIKVDEKADFALLRTEEESWAPPVEFADKTPAFATEVISFGYSAGFQRPATFFGRVMGGFAEQLKGKLMVDSSGNVGMSGGPIVTVEGKVVAMLQGGVNPPGLMHYGARVEDIRRFLR